MQEIASFRLKKETLYIQKEHYMFFTLQKEHKITLMNVLWALFKTAV